MSVLPICSKIFEKLTFCSIYEFVNKTNRFNNNQSGLRLNDSCMHRLISITQSILSVFDGNASLEICDVFLDLFKSFDRVWHDGFLYKLKSNGTDGNLCKLIKSDLNNRRQ